jgi:peroxiredoxin
MEDSVTVKVGDSAPDFTLASTTGNDITLSAFRGKSNVLLAFFPAAFSGVCTAEMCDFSNDFAEFEAIEASVLGISVDSIPTLKDFRAKNGIAVDLLSDSHREVSREYGVLLEDRSIAKRAYFVIDKEGVVTWAHVEGELGHKRDNRELLDQLSQLK